MCCIVQTPYVLEADIVADGDDEEDISDGHDDDG